jgi:thiol-disulfide isomerase/thioredoxin
LLLFLSASAAEISDSETAGIGVELGMEGPHIIVKRIFQDSPAVTQKGLHVGDRIIGVAQEQGPAIQIEKLPQALLAIRGPKGTTVRLTILPSGQEDARAQVVSIVRDAVKELAKWGDGLLLTNWTKAPDIEIIGVEGKTAERLSDHAGKIVVLEFWATWCGPCQPKMAELQHYRGDNPDWKNSVVLIAASVDDNKEIAAKHLRAKGWNQTHNVWTGPQAKRAYHIDRIPTVYMIDRQGKIAGINPKDIPEAVHELQKAQAPKAQ